MLPCTDILMNLCLNDKVYCRFNENLKNNPTWGEENTVTVCVGNTTDGTVNAVVYAAIYDAGDNITDVQLIGTHDAASYEYEMFDGKVTLGDGTLFKIFAE